MQLKWKRCSFFEKNLASRLCFRWYFLLSKRESCWKFIVFVVSNSETKTLKLLTQTIFLSTSNRTIFLILILMSIKKLLPQTERLRKSAKRTSTEIARTHRTANTAAGIRRRRSTHRRWQQRWRILVHCIVVKESTRPPRPSKIARCARNVK
jgi:hypothetical protein